MADTDTKTKYELNVRHWDEPTNEAGKPFTYVRHFLGEVVELGEADARRLLAAGAVIEPGSREKAAVEAARAVYEAALAALPAEVRAQLEDQTAAAAVPQAATGSGPGGGTTPLERPSATANKDVWLEYVVSRGSDRAEASKLDLKALQALYPEGS